MKVIVSKTKLNVVDPTKEQLLDLEKIASKAIVKEVVNGVSIKADKATLFDVLYVLSCKYDVELV